ncbi:MAG: hypothetical protein JXB32_18600 [Deltaproteobacteria bacterium]|nr:hypothetical protein [Deltaproteobacteria bacterium]
MRHGPAGILAACALALCPPGCGEGSADEDALEDDGGAENAPDTDVPLEADANDDADSPAEATDDGPGDDGTGPAPGAPRFETSASYPVTIAGNGDPADVYYPVPPDLAPGAYAFPVAVLLQGAKVDKQYYAAYAARVARYGFVVVVPNHESISMIGPGLYVEQSLPAEALAQLRAENDDPTSPIHGVIDTGTLVLLGHSYGGVAGLNLIRDVCQPPACTGRYERPAELAGGVFHGTNLATPMVGTVPDILNQGLPVALVQGTLDSKATPDAAQATYEKIADPPKALVRLAGANHYGVCDVDNPTGADPDGTRPTLDQATAVETAARWSAVFLRARVLGDADAAAYLESLGDPADANVEVEQQW